MTLSANARVKISTINEQLAKITEPGNVKRTLMGLIGTWGKLKNGCGGTATDWRVKFRENPPTPYADGDPQTAVQINRHRMAELGWLSWASAEAFTKGEKLQNQHDKTALFKLVDNAVTNAGDDFKKYMAKQLYKNGDLAGEDNMHGLETMYSDIDTAGTGTATDDYIGIPNGSYAGLNMVLNSYGQGDWTGAWPDGQGNLEYMFYSPIVADATNASWGQSSNVWQYTWRKCMNYCCTFTEALHQVMPSVWVMTPNMLREALDSLDDKERIEITQANAGGLVKLGFKGIVWNGIPMVSDYACTANVCYGIPKEHIELRNMQDQLIVTANDEDLSIKTNKVFFDSWCQLRMSTPAFFPCIRNVT